MAELSADETALLAAAREVAARAYAPYSGFHVGAAIRAEDGRVFTAANVENASYGLSLCAETNAAMAAAVAGVRRLTHVAVVGYRAATPTAPALATPCGRCRQVLNEFAGPEARVIIGDADGSSVLALTLGELLPHAFGPRQLEP
ncbi:cytidine deaminase [Acuticoccus sediminis]|uniref:Cytidine deaminase n=1 Tax=Acuticoccus sediminis TaxID=2184697 RepID=A0A8B2NQA0_9HYPH|nr:cytidine deaminase [Acuticoccus sediminis]RAH99372.1 cytidine deaminase [Acuticoccus sediminis]